MKPKSFNRDMKKELAGTLAAHGVAAVIACAATAGAWDYARWWTLSLISGLSVLLRLPTADPGPESDARRALEEYRRELESGFANPDKVTVPELGWRWHEQRKPLKNLSPLTHKTDECELKKAER